MSADRNVGSCLVIGAGMSGLLAARQLHDAGIETLLVEKGDEVGGRMATFRPGSEENDLAIGDFTGEPVFDAGAQFFTVRDPQFAKLVSEWSRAGIVTEWSRGFATADNSYYADGYPRYRGVESMASIPRYLANNLNLRSSTLVTAVEPGQEGWLVHLGGGSPVLAQAIIVTPPVPESLALFEGGTGLSEPAQQALERITYEPCIALMIQLDEPSRVPEPGGMWPIGEPIAWIADNYRKGVSPTAGTVTVHAGPEFSQRHWREEDGAVAHLLLAAVDEWLGASVRAFRVKRWRHSKPVQTHPAPFLALATPAPLIFAGDAFAGPRVEGAVLSGLAAANWLLKL